MQNNTKKLVFHQTTLSIRHLAQCHPLQQGFAAMYIAVVLSENCCIAALSAAKLNTLQVTSSETSQLLLTIKETTNIKIHKIT